MVETLLIVLVLLAVAIIVLQFVLRSSSQLGASRGDFERLERELRDGVADGRKEAQEAAAMNRTELSGNINQFSQTLLAQIKALTDANERRLGEVRDTLERKLRDLQSDNASKLDEIRKTVDERLHATLEKRLGDSFKLVSERLEAVHKGLGEMQSLAAGVGDLKRVLTNVKTRGIWGEVQLGTLLEQTLTSDQYAKNVATLPGSNERVEFAIKLPGPIGNEPMWLPIDSKFPMVDYEKLLVAQERADLQGAEEAGRALETRIKLEAKSIREKYIGPPHTTDFAFLFLPTEGLYAEVVRRPGLADSLQREYRVTVAGPYNLSATLNALQMGFRTLAIEERSSEVWEVLGAVKTEFSKFGEALAGVKRTLETAANKIGEAETRTRQISRKLKDVEVLPLAQATKLLGEPEAPEEDEEPF
ncbi:MAG: DNA recombination protein RmuC [Betaproteobacteria bacterium]|nr:MAG: DNA recombination protein RmuC [Betaproteobacteria bacterium]